MMSDGTDTGTGIEYRNFLAALTAGKQLRYSRTVCANGEFDPNWRLVGDGNYYGAMDCDITTEGQVAIAASEEETRHVHFFYEETDGDGHDPIGWSDPLDMGLPDGVDEFSQILLSRSAAGLDSVLAVDAGARAVWWKTENPDKVETKTETVTPPGTNEPIEISVEEIFPPDEEWTDWMKLPEQTLDEISCAQNSDSSLVVAGIDKSTEAIYVSQQNLEHPQSNTDWLVWNCFDSFNSQQVIAYLGPDMRMNIFALDKNEAQTVHQIVQSESCSNDYDAPTTVPDAPEALSRIKVNEGENGGLYMIGIAANADDSGLAKLYLTRQVPTEDGGSEWNDWTFIRHLTAGGLPSMDLYADGRMLIHYWSTSADGDLYYTTELSPNTGEFPAPMTKIGDDLRGLGHSHDLSIGADSL